MRRRSPTAHSSSGSPSPSLSPAHSVNEMWLRAAPTHAKSLRHICDGVQEDRVESIVKSAKRVNIVVDAPRPEVNRPHREHETRARRVFGSRHAASLAAARAASQVHRQDLELCFRRLADLHPRHAAPHAAAAAAAAGGRMGRPVHAHIPGRGVRRRPRHVWRVPLGQRFRLPVRTAPCAITCACNPFSHGSARSPRSTIRLEAFSRAPLTRAGMTG